MLFESSHCVTFLFEFFRPWKKALKSNVGLFVSRTLTLSFSRIIYGIMFCYFSPTTTKRRTKQCKMKNWIIVTKCVLLQQLLTTIKHCKLALTDKKDKKKNYFSIFFPQHFPKNCGLVMQRHELIKYGKTDGNIPGRR